MGKVLELLTFLDRKEMTRFNSFVYSPYFNKHKKVRQLVSYLNDIFPDFDAENCKKHTLFDLLFPGDRFDNNKLAVVFTYTQRLLEQFLSIEWAERQEKRQEIGLLEQFREKKQYKFYEKRIERLEDKINDSSFGDSADLYYRYQLISEKDTYFEQKERRQKDDSLQRKHNLLDYYYLAEKFKDACEMHVRSKILKIEYSSRMIDFALDEVTQNPELYKRIPAIYIYYNIYRMLKKGDSEDYYQNAYQYLKEQEQSFSRKELNNLYKYLQNHCIEKINQGNGAYFKKIFQLYKSQLENGLLMVKGILSEWHYKNIVNTAIHLGELEWVSDFIESYKKLLAPAVAENAYQFNKATYYHAVGQYDKVLELLSTVEYSDQRYSLGAKALLLRTYYELEELEPLVSLTDSFRQFLLRNKLMADQKRKGYYNSFKLAKKAAIIRANSVFYTKERCRKEIGQLERAINNTANILNRPWLIEKVEELKQLL